MSKVSVLFPNYNNAPYLKQALDSVFAQTFQDFIIYFVDDCSTDDSVAIAKSYGDDRLVIIEKEKNSGIVDTMNIALEKISTKYFIRMDGDDISTPNRFEILINFMDAHPKIGVCTSAIRTFGKTDELLLFGKDPEMNKASLIFGHAVGHASSIFRTLVFKENNIIYLDDYWRMEDYYLFYRLKNLTDTIAIDDELYLYRRGEYNDNKEITEKKKKEFFRIYELILSELEISATNEELEMHYQLALKTSPTKTLNDFNSYIAKLLTANEKLGIFPQLKLKQVLNNRMSKVLFRLVDSKQIGLGSILKESFRVKGLFRYYCRKLLKGL